VNIPNLILPDAPQPYQEDADIKIERRSEVEEPEKHFEITLFKLSPESEMKNKMDLDMKSEGKYSR
jgi:hypothetical protein